MRSFFLALCLLSALCSPAATTSAIPPLIVAAGEGDAATVRALLAQGTAATTLSPEGESALHVAGITGDPDTVSALLAAGADPNARNPAGTQLRMTPLMWAAYGGHTDMIRQLLAGGADPSLLDELGKAGAENRGTESSGGGGEEQLTPLAARPA